MLTLVLVTLVFATAASAARYPSRVPAKWHAVDRPSWFRAAMCVHQHEGAWNSNTGNGYFGGMQFTSYTWWSVRGPSLPHLVSPREQLYRAWLVWLRDGRSWREWGTAGMCGLR